MTVAELKEYLGMIVQTEKEVNLQEELCARMSRGIREYENQINILHNNMRTMEKTNQELIQTLDDVMKIQQEGREKRQAAEADMRRMENELKTKLLEIRR